MTRRSTSGKTDSGSDTLLRLRTLCLALPETTEAGSWGHPNFRAGKRTFVTFETVGGKPSIAFLMERDEVGDFLIRKGFFPTPYGRGTWVSLDVSKRFSWHLVEALVEKSYRLVAIKRMIDRLDADVPR